VGCIVPSALLLESALRLAFCMRKIVSSRKNRGGFIVLGF
jgi:hypothetical protein